MKKLAKRNPYKLLDLLAERLTFERVAVQLYDTVLAKMKKIDLPDMRGVLALIGQIQAFREQEKEHEEWLEGQIRSLGGDAHEKTALSDLVERETRGVQEVVAKDGQLDHLFHALLAAELLDDIGWKLLLTLADEADDADAREAFKKRSQHEDEHLVFVREIVAAFARAGILGRETEVAMV